ncbi:uncharacterized protein KY384_003422 [Bacidia gigantensis]|uniref:uncharacterized protein n=1 Tax=Bacidia gigantensis TaxID=2732470 RepID=UPI001D057D75|nr:uncharacterized protein KY384_003422 [Bacidia gigantensis]KAG8531786.1 hypothetical protein KY384_003422 [Bacidia gigantensis]
MASDEGNWGPGIIGLAATCEGLVLIFISLRIYTRVWLAKAFWWDDATMIFAVLGTTIGCSLCFVEVHYGFGKHYQYLTDREKHLFRKYTFGEWIQTFATLMWTKISICLFLVRFTNNQRLRTVMYWTVGFLLISNTVMTVMWIMQCQPVNNAWVLDGKGTCMSKFEKEAVILTQAIISIVSDFVFAAFPIFYFWRLQVDLKTKIGLWLLMCLGFITGVCCIVRTVLNGQSLPDDETYDGIVNWTWRLFEVQMGIIAACIPTLRPLYSLIFKKIRGEKDVFASSNVKMLGNEKEHWLGDASNGHDSDGRSPPSASSSQHPPRHQSVKAMKAHHGEDMTHDLINDGIIQSKVPNGKASEHRSASNAGLLGDMDRYGIGEGTARSKSKVSPKLGVAPEEIPDLERGDRTSEEQAEAGLEDDMGKYGIAE